MTGPSLGGVLLQHFGFSTCMTVMGLICLVVVSEINLTIYYNLNTLYIIVILTFHQLN